MRKQVLMVVLLAVAALFFVPFDGFAQKRNAKKPAIMQEDVSVSFSFVDSPHISYEKNTIGSPHKQEYKWLLVKVLYRFNAQYKSGFTFDNMRCEIALRTIASKSGWKKNYWFTGTQKFFSVIPGKPGSVHQVLFFMPPPLLYKATEGAKVNVKLFRDCVVYLRFFDGNNKLLGRRIWAGAIKGGKLNKQMESTAVRAYNRMNDNPGNKFVNGFWPQEKTPWQWLNADRMDLPLPVFDTKAPAAGSRNSNGEDAIAEEKESVKNDTDNEKNGAAEAEETAESIEFTRPADNKNRKNKRN